MVSQLEHTTSGEAGQFCDNLHGHGFNLKLGHNIIEFLYLKPLLAM